MVRMFVGVFTLGVLFGIVLTIIVTCCVVEHAYSRDVEAEKKKWEEKLP